MSTGLSQVFSLPGVETGCKAINSLEGLREGGWVPLAEATDNHSRLARVPIGQTLDAVRFTLDATWGAAETHLYAFHLD